MFGSGPSCAAEPAELVTAAVAVVCAGAAELESRAGAVGVIRDDEVTVTPAASAATGVASETHIAAKAAANRTDLTGP